MVVEVTGASTVWKGSVGSPSGMGDGVDVVVVGDSDFARVHFGCRVLDVDVACDLEEVFAVSVSGGGDASISCLLCVLVVSIVLLSSESIHVVA